MCSAGSKTVLGWQGWRFVFLSVGLFSMVIGMLNWLQASDPHYTPDGKSKLGTTPVTGVQETWREMRIVMTIPTFLLIVLQVGMQG